MSSTKEIFDTDKRIRLGIWGLGRGSAFLKCAAALHIDVVAGCDFNDSIREKFHAVCPDAYLTADEDEFLALDLDAVLIATFFENHADHAIKALRAGKHVMSEVTSFFTPAEGVRLIEAVEASGKVYNLLENYPFMKNNLTAKKLWDQGIFGEFSYGEYDYNHDCRQLSFTYLNGSPVEPGDTLHNWRSWLNSLYYNTHSLGPVMRITGLRPVEVTAPLSPVSHPGETKDTGLGVSFVRMSNGGILRNFMGGLSHDTHSKRLWGTRGFLDFTSDCVVALGASGHGRVLRITPEWPEFGEIADSMGHGGGDFWELYYFAREVLYGVKAPWDVYSAADVTLAGIMSVRSQAQGGIPVKIPDFRDPAVREAYRRDEGAQSHFDPDTAAFPAGHDPAITGNFTRLMSRLLACEGMILVRNVFDGMKLYPMLADDTSRLAVIRDVRKLIAELPKLADAYREGLRVVEAYPESMAARLIRGVLAAGEREKVLDSANTAAELRAFLERESD